MTNFPALLTQGVGSWLQFEHVCNRNGLFSEKYLTLPIGQILSGRTGTRTVAEWKHPVLQSLMTGPGRKPEIDFVVLENHKIEHAVESKWAGDTVPDVGRIIWDLIRLELVANATEARCYFVLAGKTSQLKTLFERLHLKATFEGSVKDLLPIKHHAQSTIYLTARSTGLIPVLKKLYAPYQSFDFPHGLTIRGAEPFETTRGAKGYQVYAWEIRPMTKRQTFKPGSSPLLMQNKPKES